MSHAYFFETEAAALQEIFNRTIGLRSPYEDVRGPDAFVRERASVASNLSASLRGEKS